MHVVIDYNNILVVRSYHKLITNTVIEENLTFNLRYDV